jgi:hypothetical protein
MDRVYHQGDREYNFNSLPIADIEIHMHDFSATHNYPCPICREKHAVLDLSCGVMKPCRDCRDWVTIKPSKLLKFIMRWVK